jgi:hypothetical protein
MCDDGRKFIRNVVTPIKLQKVTCFKILIFIYTFLKISKLGQSVVVVIVVAAVAVKFSRYRPKQALGDPEG